MKSYSVRRSPHLLLGSFSEIYPVCEFELSPESDIHLLLFVLYICAFYMML